MYVFVRYAGTSHSHRGSAINSDPKNTGNGSTQTKVERHCTGGEETGQ